MVLSCINSIQPRYDLSRRRIIFVQIAYIVLSIVFLFFLQSKSGVTLNKAL